MAEMELYEKCPRCNSMSCTTELSTSNRVTKCNSCGYEGNISKFQEHKGYELSKEPPKDFFGKKILPAEDLSRKLEMIKRLDIQC